MNFVGIGPVTRERVHARTRELALIAGRLPPHVTQSDYEQARREVTGESDFDRQEAMLEPNPDPRNQPPGFSAP